MTDEPKQPRTKLADPQGMIARTRARLNPQCAVRLSPFCDVVISMRLQGVPFKEIEDWLVERGDQFRIAAPTIHRNLAQARAQVKLTYGEEMLENLGGQVEVNLIREMSTTIWTQKQRIDKMVRAEEARRGTPGNENYSDKRIRYELEVYNELLKGLHATLQEAPAKALEAQEAEQKRLDSQGMWVSPDAVAVLRDLILNNELVLGGNDLLLDSKARH